MDKLWKHLPVSSHRKSKLLYHVTLLQFVIFFVCFPVDKSHGLLKSNQPADGIDFRCLSDSQSAFRSEDGFCNNVYHAAWGRSRIAYKRYVAPQYEDGVAMPRKNSNQHPQTPLPNARLVSATLHDGSSGSGNEPHVALMAAQFGQFLGHDMTHASLSADEHNGLLFVPRCCNRNERLVQKSVNCTEISVPENDQFFSQFGQNCLEFVRSISSSSSKNVTREQLNQATSFIDGSQIYGSTFGASVSLRSFSGGELKHGKTISGEDLMPDDHTDATQCLFRHGDKHARGHVCFRAGDIRCNEQAGLTALHTVFLRLHNNIARTFARQINRNWNDERIYQETRKIVGAVLQHITYNEFLPVVLGFHLSKYNLRLLGHGYFDGYDPARDPTIANAFSTAAFRFGHTLVQGSLLLIDGATQQRRANFSLEQSFFDPVVARRYMNEIIRGLIAQNSQKMDRHIDKQLTNHLFALPGIPFGADLAAINIARGRDHGLPGYNIWRRWCGLKVARNWEDLDGQLESEAIEKMRQLYLSPDDIDLYSAGISELPMNSGGGLVGPTFACIISKQFEDLRIGDRYWYENAPPQGFSAEQLQQIRRMTLASVICNTTADTQRIQKYAMIAVDPVINPLVDCITIPRMDLTKWIDTINGQRRKC